MPPPLFFRKQIWNKVLENIDPWAVHVEADAIFIAEIPLVGRWKVDEYRICYIASLASIQAVKDTPHNF